MTTLTNEAFNEATIRVLEFFSSSFMTTEEKVDYLNFIGEDYNAQDVGLFSACVASMVAAKDRALYHSVFPIVEYK